MTTRAFINLEAYRDGVRRRMAAAIAPEPDRAPPAGNATPASNGPAETRPCPWADYSQPLDAQLADAARVYADVCQLRRHHGRLAVCTPGDLAERGVNPVILYETGLWERAVKAGETILHARWLAENEFAPAKPAASSSVRGQPS